MARPAAKKPSPVKTGRITRATKTSPAGVLISREGQAFIHANMASLAYQCGGRQISRQS